MGDIRIVFDPATFTGDFAMSGPDLAQGFELETAVLISLFSDITASPDDILPPQQVSDPRGWWADSYTLDPIGSKAWQVFWRQTTTDTLNWFRDTAQKALQWMIDDGLAASVTVQPQIIGRGLIEASVVIVEPNGNRSPFAFVWSQKVI